MGQTSTPSTLLNRECIYNVHVQWYEGVCGALVEFGCHRHRQLFSEVELITVITDYLHVGYIVPGAHERPGSWAPDCSQL